MKKQPLALLCILAINGVVISESVNAGNELDEANKKINIVWNGTTKAIRKQLLPEQRSWLKKRKADCKTEPNPEDCMVNMTIQRTEELKHKIVAISEEKDNNQHETTNTEVERSESTQSSKIDFYLIIKLVLIYYVLKHLYSFLKRLRLKNKANKIIDKKIKEHIKALSLKRKQKIEHDAYGNIIYEKWFKEIDYFIKNILCENAIVGNYINSSNNNVSDKIIDAVSEYDRNNKTTHDDIDVSDLSPTEFEHYCADILSRNRWKTRVTQASGDQGIDIIATYGNIKAVFQCKKYSNPIGNKAVQEIVAGKQFEKANIAAVVSNKGYTASAKQLAQSTGTYLLHYSELADFHKKIGL